MGEIKSLRCGACGAEWRCMEGSGLLYGKKENIITAFSGRERTEAAGRIEKSEIPAYDFSFQIAVCNHCHNVVSLPSLIVGDEEPYVGSCPLCGKRAKKPISEMEGTACPKCKSRFLSEKIEGHWD